MPGLNSQQKCQHHFPSYMPILNEKEVAAAKAYKYNGEDVSILKQLFLAKWWDFCLKFIPMKMAPNTITFVGFLFEVFSFLVSFYFSDCMRKELPNWVCILNGVCLFIYQTMDNLDGRQARRTKSSSPLGQFFDHGCDAITGVLEMMKVSASLSFGCSKRTFFFVFLMGIGFFMTSWEEYVVHHFYLGKFNGPDEGLLILAIVHVLVAFFPQIRAYSETPYATAAFIGMDVITIGVIVRNVIINSIKNKEMHRRAFPSLLPCIITVAIFISLYFLHPETVETPFFTMAAGLVLQFGGQNVIVSFLIGRSPRYLYSFATIVLWVGAVASYFVTGIISSSLFWQIYFWATIAFMIEFDVKVVLGLSEGLGVPIFHIKAKEE